MASWSVRYPSTIRKALVTVLDSYLAKDHCKDPYNELE